MKEAILTLLQLLIKLARASSDDPTIKAKLAQKLQDHKAFIDTFHGDSDFNDLEVQEALDTLTEVLSSSTPAPEHEELPDDTYTDDLSPADANSVEGETQAARQQSNAAAGYAEQTPTEEDSSESSESESSESSSSEDEKEEAPKKETPSERIKRIQAEKSKTKK